MKITCLGAKQVGSQLKRLMLKATEYHWAVAWATDTAFSEILVANKHKIRKIVIGTDFAQTSPNFLRSVKAFKKVHVMSNTTMATFHPKVYCFIDGGNVSAIIGSANFTNGGTYRNTEFSLLLESTIDDEPIRDILSSVSSWWRESQEIDEEFLAAYELRHAANQKHRKAIKKATKLYHPSTKSKHPKLLTTSWDDYLNELQTAANGAIDRRLAVLHGARQLLGRVTSFSDLDILERKALAGIIGSREILGTDLKDKNWGWFGSMKGAGVFKNRIVQNDVHLSLALDNIPPIGEVSEDDYGRFSEEYRLAFSNSTRAGSIVTASRLLAMKRPDYFVCVDSMNATRLSANFGFARSALNLRNYWELVVEPITLSKWWNVERPAGIDGKVWDSRAAMLDVIYYDGELE